MRSYTCIETWPPTFVLVCTIQTQPKIKTQHKRSKTQKNVERTQKCVEETQLLRSKTQLIRVSTFRYVFATFLYVFVRFVTFPSTHYQVSVRFNTFRYGYLRFTTNCYVLLRIDKSYLQVFWNCYLFWYILYDLLCRSQINNIYQKSTFNIIFTGFSKIN